MQDQTRPRYFRVKDVAARFNVSAATIHRAIKAGDIPHVRLGRSVLVPASAVAKLDSQADAAAEGLACVVCDRDFVAAGVTSVPVARSASTGSQVFACAGDCAGRVERDELSGEVA